MEKRVIYVVLMTVLLVALVAAVVFLNGNSQQADTRVNSTATQENVYPGQQAGEASLNITAPAEEHSAGNSSS